MSDGITGYYIGFSPNPGNVNHLMLMDLEGFSNKLYFPYDGPQEIDYCYAHFLASASGGNSADSYLFVGIEGHIYEDTPEAGYTAFRPVIKLPYDIANQE